jgi:hypothetical protein
LGDHDLRVRAIDQAGNMDGTPASYGWSVIDARAPETSVDSGPPSSTADTTATVRFSSDEEGSSFECSLDGDAFSPCESPKAYDGLSLGGHTVRVRATDQAGNTDTSPAAHGDRALLLRRSWLQLRMLTGRRRLHGV